MRAGSGREFLRIVGKIARSVFHAVEEDATDLRTVAVNCRDNDVAGHVVSELNNHFRKVGFTRGDAFVLEELVEVRFLGRHRLDLDDFIDSLGLDDVGDDAVRLVLVASPVNNAAACGDVAFELFEKLGKAGFDLKLDGFSSVTQIFPVGHFGNALAALGANRPGCMAKVAAHLRIGKGAVCAFGESWSPTESVLGDSDGRPPSSGVNRGVGIVTDDSWHTNKGFRHIRSPERFPVRMKCCQGRAGPWLMQGFQQGASGGCPNSDETSRRQHA